MKGGLDTLVLRLTNRCNLACGYCYAGSGPAGEDLSPERAAEAVALACPPGSPAHPVHRRGAPAALGHGGEGAGLRPGLRTEVPRRHPDQRHAAHTGALPGAEGPAGGRGGEPGRGGPGQRRPPHPGGGALLPGDGPRAPDPGGGRHGGQPDRGGVGGQCARPGPSAGLRPVVRQRPRCGPGSGAAPGPGRGGGAVPLPPGAGRGFEPPAGPSRSAGPAGPPGAAQGAGAPAPAAAHGLQTGLLLQRPDWALPGGDAGRPAVALLRPGRGGGVPPGYAGRGDGPAAESLPRAGTAGGMRPLSRLRPVRRGLSCRPAGRALPLDCQMHRRMLEHACRLEGKLEWWNTWKTAFPDREEPDDKEESQ